MKRKRKRRRRGRGQITVEEEEAGEVVVANLARQKFTVALVVDDHAWGEGGEWGGEE